MSDRIYRQKISKGVENMNSTINQPDLVTFMEHPIQQHQNIHFFKVQTNFFKDRYAMFWAIKQVSVYAKKI